MKKPGMKIVLILVAVVLICGIAAGVWALANGGGTQINEVPSDQEYNYVNPDETKADADEGFTIDGILDEEAYQNNHWLYLHNDDGGNNVDIAMTSYYGEKGMYFVFDVTETVPIYVNLNRSSYLNSCIELYFAPSTVTGLKANSIFEVDLLPTGDMTFKMSNGKGGYVNVATTDDIMACLGATTKGGEVNTEDCYGYCLELFIPWDYMQWLGMDVETMKTSFVYVDPAHITSHNLTGTDTSVDRYWYYYAQQLGAGFSDVTKYFRFDGNGVLGSIPVTLTGGEHYTITGDKSVIPSMETSVTVTPENGYALTSILVNGEEYIQKVSYNEDGSVTLTLRATSEGLTVSAAAEAVTAGNKTLSGTVQLHKYGGDSVDGLLVTYIGPEGEKPVTIDENGNFELKDLAQGYYTLTAEKKGYGTVSRSIYLSRDIDTQITLEYEMFYVEGGTCWMLDSQNDGVLHKLGGTGYVLSTDSYNAFTFEANFKYDAELAAQSDTTSFTEQRSGMRIRFSNGKYWNINLLYQGENYILQYAARSGSIHEKYRTLHVLDEAQTAKYLSGEGITLTVVRDGQRAAVYLDGELLAVEELGEEYESCTAQLGFEAWVANEDTLAFPYSISGDVAVDVKNSYFLNPEGWIITGQYDGVVSLADGGRGNLTFADKYVNMDLTITVRDYDDPTDTFARNDVLLVFENGAHVSFGIAGVESEGIYLIQALNNSANDGQEIYSRYKSFGVLTEEEAAKLQTEGVDFRIVRIGTEVSLYIDGRLVGVADLTNNDRGVTADMEATVTLRHYDDAGVQVDIPFSMTDELEIVTVNCPETQYGKVTTNKQNYIVGDTVILSDGGKDGYYLVGAKINGKEVTLNWDGTYSFVAEKKEYTAEGEFAARIFQDSAEWGGLGQCDGILTIPNSDGDSGWIESYRQDYTDLDVTVTLHDLHTADDNYRAAIRLVFSNGEYVTFTLTNDQSNDDDPNIYNLQNMGGSILNWTQVKGYSLSADQVAALQSEEGLEFRVVRCGAIADLYVGGEHVWEFDLSTNKDGNPSGVADLTTNVQLRFYGNIGEDVEVPFSIGTELELVDITCSGSENGTVATKHQNYLVGETVILTGTGAEGYYCSGMTANGAAITMNEDGTASFVAEKNAYTVKGTFSVVIFRDSDEWNELGQCDGILTIPNADGDSGWIQSYRSDYKDVDLTLTLRDLHTADDNYRAAVRLVFSNGEYVTFTLTNDQSNDDDPTVYNLQNMGGSILNWTQVKGYSLSADQVAALQSEEGLEFRVVRCGTIADLYVGGEHVWEFDLSTNKDGNPSGVADLTTNVQLRFYGNIGEDLEVPFTLIDEVDDVTVSITGAANGTLTADQKNYIVGETVTLTGTGNAGYYCCGMTVDGKTVTINENGTYSFTAAGNHTASAEFAVMIFKDSADWSEFRQNEGILAIPNSDGDSYWVDSYRTDYTDIDLTLTLKDLCNADDNYRAAVRLIFGNGKYVTFTVTNDMSNDDATTVYALQNMGGDYYNWKYTGYVLTDEQVAAIQSDSGLAFRIVRVGNIVDVYIGGVHAYEYVLDSEVADLTAQILLRFYGNNGKSVEVPFEIVEEVNAVNVTVSDTANGTVTTDQKNYLVGEQATVTVAGSSGYYHTGLKVNGETVTVGWDGTYSFTATQDTTVSCGFAESIFKENNANWNLINQNVGVLYVPSTVTGNTGWIETVDNYNELSVTVKDYSGGTVNEYAVVGSLYFSNGKYVSIRLINNNGTYSLQSMGDSVANWGTHYTLTEAQKAKVLGDGIVFRMTRIGTTLNLYLDGELVKKVDLTGRSSGITADMTCIARIRYYNFGYAAEMPFTVGNPEQKVTVNVAATTNGTITTDKDSYLVGDTVTLKVNPGSGYAYSSLKVDGQEVTVSKDGTYSFTVTKDTYEVSGTFAAAIFKENANWNLINQNQGILYVPSTVTGNTGWLETVENYNELSITVKDYSGGEKNEYAVVGSLYFSNGKYVSIRLINNNGTYILQSMGDSVANWGIHHTLTDAQVAKVQGDGIEFTMTRKGTLLFLYLDDELVKTVDLTARSSGITAEMTCIARIRYYNFGYAAEMPFTVGNPEQKVTVNVAATANGTVTTDKSSYLVGETVTLTVTGNSGYYYSGLTVNGKSVTVDWDGTYSFTATENVYNITATFAAASITRNGTNSWNLFKQNVGLLRLDSHASGNSGWVDSAANTNDVTTVIKDCTPDSKDFAMIYHFTFSNGETFRLRVNHTDSDGVYRIQSMSSSSLFAVWKSRHDFTTEQTAKITGNGIEFRVIIIESTAHVYLDGVKVCEYAFTKDVSAETVKVALRMDGNLNQDVEVPFTLRTTTVLP